MNYITEDDFFRIMRNIEPNFPISRSCSDMIYQRNPDALINNSTLINDLISILLNCFESSPDSISRLEACFVLELSSIVKSKKAKSGPRNFIDAKSNKKIGLIKALYNKNFFK
jgi:hypothetical protein